MQLLLNEITRAGSTWINREGREKRITLDDLLIIAPYNAQAYELQQRLPGARIGTVDKFQARREPS